MAFLAIIHDIAHGDGLNLRGTSLSHSHPNSPAVSPRVKAVPWSLNNDRQASRYPGIAPFDRCVQRILRPAGGEGGPRKMVPQYTEEVRKCKV